MPFSAPGTPPLTGTIDLQDVAFGEKLENALGHDRAGGRKIDEAADAFAFDDAVRPGGNGKHDVRRRQARHDCLGGVGDFRRRARRDRADRGEIADRLLAGVVDHDVVPGFDQPARHVRAHIAETNEADVHCISPLAILL